MLTYKKILYFAFLVFPLAAFGQTLSQYSINSASGFFSADLTLDYTLGQLVTSDFHNQKIITSGFVQTYQVTENKKNTKQNLYELNVALYPNPVSALLYCTIASSDKIETFQVEIFDINGRKINIPAEISGYDNFKKVTFDLSVLSVGNYSIRIIINQSVIKNFTITKI